MNQVQLQARIFEVKPLRHTPAGISVLDLVLEHRSTVVEAGIPRQLEFYVDARILGKQAEQLAHLGLGIELELQGFLANSRKNSKRLVFHIQSFNLLNKAISDDARNLATFSGSLLV